MTVEERVLEKLRRLPPKQREEVLEFVDRLSLREIPLPPRASLRGLWKDLGIDISDEDIARARREMWGNFRRDIA